MAHNQRMPKRALYSSLCSKVESKCLLNINNHTVAHSYLEIGSNEWCCRCDPVGFRGAVDTIFYENWVLYVASVDLEITPVFKWNPRKLAEFKKKKKKVLLYGFRGG